MANAVTISGGGATSIFKITGGDVTIKRLTLRDGFSQGGNGATGGYSAAMAGGGGGAGLGGAIAIANGNATIESVNFINRYL